MARRVKVIAHDRTVPRAKVNVIGPVLTVLHVKVSAPVLTVRHAKVIVPALKALANEAPADQTRCTC